MFNRVLDIMVIRLMRKASDGIGFTFDSHTFTYESFFWTFSFQYLDDGDKLFFLCTNKQHSIIKLIHDRAVCRHLNANWTDHIMQQ